jgi:hypothetical protein
VNDCEHVSEGESVLEKETVGLRTCVAVGVVDGDAVLVVDFVGVDDKDAVAERVAISVEVVVDDGEIELEMLRDLVTDLLGVAELDNVGVSVGVYVTEPVEVCETEVVGVVVGEEDGEQLIEELVVDDDVGVTEGDTVIVSVYVGVRVDDKLNVGDHVTVTVGVTLIVTVAVGVRVIDSVQVADGMRVPVDVTDGVGDALSVEDGLLVHVDECVGEIVAVNECERV